MKRAAVIRKGPASQRYRQGGITLIELIVTVVVLGIALLGIAIMLSRGVGQSADVMIGTRAAALGQAYLDEILTRRFDEQSGPGGVPSCGAGCSGGGGPDAGEDVRSRFDDVDDFNGLSEGFGVAAPDDILRDAEGNPRDGYEGFSVEVSVGYAGGDAGVGGNPTSAKRIDVTVSHSNGDRYVFSAYKGNY